MDNVVELKLVPPPDGGTMTVAAILREIAAQIDAGTIRTPERAVLVLDGGGLAVLGIQMPDEPTLAVGMLTIAAQHLALQRR